MGISYTYIVGESEGREAAAMAASFSEAMRGLPEVRVGERCEVNSRSRLVELVIGFPF